MLYFIGGVVVGTVIGVILMALATASKMDELMNEFHERNNKEGGNDD